MKYHTGKVIQIFISGVGLFTAAILALTNLAGAAPARPPLAADWEADIRVSTNSHNGATSPVIVDAPNGDLFIAYVEKNNSNIRNIRYVRSANNGSSWSAPANIHANSVTSWQVSLGVGQNNQAHAVWIDVPGSSPDQLRYSRQDNWGGAPMTLRTSPSVSRTLLDPSIYVSGNGVIDVVWAEANATSQFDIFHIRSTNNGASWSAISAALDNDTGGAIHQAGHPTIGVDAAGDIHLLWEEIISFIPPQTTRIQYRKGTVNGNAISWGTTQTISPAGIDNLHRPTISIAGNVVTAAFTRREGQDPNTLYHAYYTKLSGNSWSPPIDTTHNNPIGVNGVDPKFMLPTVTLCGGATHIYYHGTLSQAENEGIYGASSSDGWTREQVTLLNNRNLNPWLTCATGKLHLAYEQVNGSTSQIYYRQGTVESNIFLPMVTR